MRRTLCRLFFAASGFAAAACSVTPEPPATEADVTQLVSSFPPTGFTKVNATAFRSEAAYSTDDVNVWVNDVANELYPAVPGVASPVEPSWSAPWSDSPNDSFAQGSVLVREDTTTGELAIMARLPGADVTGEQSWKWMKKDATGVHEAQGCWACHGAFGTTDSAIGVNASLR